MIKLNEKRKPLRIKIQKAKRGIIERQYQKMKAVEQFYQTVIRKVHESQHT